MFSDKGRISNGRDIVINGDCGEKSGRILYFVKRWDSIWIRGFRVPVSVPVSVPVWCHKQVVLYCRLGYVENNRPSNGPGTIAWNICQ